jgi:zinc protease
MGFRLPHATGDKDASAMRIQRGFAQLLLPSIAVLFASAVGADDLPKAPELAVDAYRLPNGLKVVLHCDRTVPRVTVCMAYHVGSKNERAGRTGFAHFFEHMMFRGTEHVPNYDLPLQEAGADSNAFTSEDITGYFETVPSNFLERALYLEAERLAFLPSALDQEKFDTEREVVKNERLQSYDNVPYGQAEEALLGAVYPPGHPYSWPVIGSMKDLDAASLEDLRQFFFEFYHPGNATICLAGDFDPEQAKSWITRYFGPLEAGPRPRQLNAVPVSPSARTLELADRVQLPRLYWSWPTVAEDHPDAPALDLLAAVLSDGDASRLERALVRERRVATDVTADSESKEIGGRFTLEATAAEGRSIDDVARALSEELQVLSRNPPTAEELARALAKYEKHTYDRLVAPLGRATVLAIGFAEKDDPKWYRREFARYFQVTPADLNRVAERYLRPERVSLVIRPMGPEENKPELTPVGPPAGVDDGFPLAARAPAAGPDWSLIPGPSKPPEFAPPKFTRKTLSNGIDVWIASWRTLPIVSMRLLLPVGTADDPASRSGLAMLTARLLDQGTTARTATELSEALDALGASLGVGTDNDWTSYSLRVLARQLEPSLELFSEVVRQPRFDRQDFEREKALQLADLLQGPDNAAWIASRVFRSLLYGLGHPYGHPRQGTTQSVESLDLNDAREFHRTRFGPKGAILIVVGDVDPSILLPQLERALGHWSGGDSDPPPRPKAEPESEPGVVYLVNKPGAVQSVITVGRRWIDRSNPFYFATEIGNRILGGDFLSRLNQNLREEHGYSYGAGSMFLYRRNGSTWAVSTSVRADATAESLHEILKELDGLAGQRPFTTDEIKTARETEMRSYPESFESPEKIAGSLQEMAMYNLPGNYLEKVLDQLEAAPSEEIRHSMIELVAPKERVILVVGDRATVEPALRKVGFSTIRRLAVDGRPSNEDRP